MKKIAVVFTAIICINSVIRAQDTQELKYFKSDNAFYLDNSRLSDSEVERTLLSNISAFDMWKKGNSLKIANTTMKISTGVLIPVGSVLIFIGFIEAAAMATATVSLIPLYILSGTQPPSNDNSVSGWFVAGITLFSAGVITGIMIPITKANYKSCYSNAASIYNKSKNAVSLHIGTTGNGIGFSLKF